MLDIWQDFNFNPSCFAPLFSVLFMFYIAIGNEVITQVLIGEVFKSTTPSSIDLYKSSLRNAYGEKVEQFKKYFLFVGFSCFFITVVCVFFNSVMITFFILGTGNVLYLVFKNYFLRGFKWIFFYFLFFVLIILVCLDHFFFNLMVDGQINLPFLRLASYFYLFGSLLLPIVSYYTFLINKAELVVSNTPPLQELKKNAGNVDKAFWG